MTRDEEFETVRKAAHEALGPATVVRRYPIPFLEGLPARDGFVYSVAPLLPRPSGPVEMTFESDLLAMFGAGARDLLTQQFARLGA
jgi:hypothetical protein